MHKSKSTSGNFGGAGLAGDAVSLAWGESSKTNPINRSATTLQSLPASRVERSNGQSVCSSQLEYRVHEEVFLSGPSVLLVNFDGASLVHFESAFRVSIYRLGDAQVDIFNLGSARTQLAKVYGTAPTVVLLRIPHPTRDPRGFSWAQGALCQLVTRRTTQVVPVIRESELPLAFLKSIASSCPYYMSLSGDYGEHCRMLTALLETIG